MFGLTKSMCTPDHYTHLFIAEHYISMHSTLIVYEDFSLGFVNLTGASSCCMRVRESYFENSAVELKLKHTQTFYTMGMMVRGAHTF